MVFSLSLIHKTPVHNLELEGLNQVLIIPDHNPNYLLIVKSIINFTKENNTIIKRLIIN